MYIQSWKRYTLVGTSFLVLSSLMAIPASAQPNWNRDRNVQPPVPASAQSNWNRDRNIQPPVPVVQPNWNRDRDRTIQRETIVTPTTVSRFVTFSDSQRNRLSDLLRRNDFRNDLIAARTHQIIVNYARPLPPEFQRQLLRGRDIPPGIANRILLSKQVNSYLNVPANYDIYVIGSNAVVYDPIQSLVVDLLTNLF